MKAIAVLAFLLSLPLAGSASEYDLVITNVTVIDAVNPTRPDQSVAISDGRIQAIRPSGKTIQAARVLDGTGRYLIPGLWDMHVHIVYEATLVDRMPDLFLDYGITSVRDTGALLDRILPQVSRWGELGAQAPDLYFSGPLLDGSLVVYDGNGRTEIGIANPSPEAARRTIQTLQDAGVDFIKIYELVSPEVFAAFVEAASSAQLPIAAHVPLSMRAETAGPRVNSMEHLRNVEIACADSANTLHQRRVETLNHPGQRSGYELRSHLHSSQRPVALQTADPDSPQCRKVLRALRNTTQVPTLRLNTITTHSPAKRADWSEHLKRLPPALAQMWSESAEYFANQPSPLGNQMSAWSLALTRAMLAEGVPIGAGTDTPIGQAIPGYSLHTELERLVEAGLSPRQALYAATVAPAKFFGLEHKMGQIQPGMEADLILLSADPLQNIHHTRNVKAVISDGVQVR